MTGITDKVAGSMAIAGSPPLSRGIFISKPDGFSVILSLGFIMSFTIGIFQYLNIPMLVPKLAAICCFISIFLVSLYVCSKKGSFSYSFKYFYTVFGLFFAGTVSYLINDVSLWAYLLFLRDFLPFYCLFLAVLNISNFKYKFVNNVLITLFIIQIPVSWLKLSLIGINEHWIGTVHFNAGQLSVMLPLVAISFLFSTYLNKGKTYLIFIIIFFIAFSMIGQKRATIVFVPVLLGVLYFFNIWFLKERIISFRRIYGAVRNIFFLTLVAFFTIYIGCRITPSLNPDQTNWGEFDIEHVYSYIIAYNVRDYGDAVSFRDIHTLAKNKKGTENLVSEEKVASDPSFQMGRASVTKLAVKKILNSDIQHMLFGFGPMVSRESRIAGNDFDQMYSKFGIRGSTTGFVTFLLEYGLFGVVVMTLLFCLVQRDIMKHLRDCDIPSYKPYYLGCLGLNFVFVLDFFIYSQSTLLFGVLLPVYFYCIALSHRMARSQFLLSRL